MNDEVRPSPQVQHGESAQENPLLSAASLPRFSAIRAEHVEPAVRHVLGLQRQALLEAQQIDRPGPGWLDAIERIQEAVHRVWSPVSHLNAVLSSPDLREAYNRCLPLISEFGTEVGQNERLFRRFEQLAQSGLEGAAAELVRQALRDFRLAGVALSGEAKNRFKRIMQELAQRQAQFEQNLMDATDAFQHHVRDAGQLAGLPEVVVERAREAAAAKGVSGWLLSLDPPTYMAVMSHAESRSLRSLFYEAWVTRASDRGPFAGRWDNGPLIGEILDLRHEAAALLGFPSYCELSLATKMAGSAEEVLGFLRDLAARSRPVALAELEQLGKLADAPLEAWDVAFYAEQLKQARFRLSEEELRPYFPLPKVLEGLFELVERLFAVKIVEVEAAGAWHPDVRYYELLDAARTPIGGFFADFFARPNKRGGAWMDGAVNRARLQGLEQQPVAHLVCNFNPPVGGQASLLTHGDVVTLFHEFGHALHHLLTEVDYPSLAGTNGVAWDAVELPSQFFENYAWLGQVLRRISAHVSTGEPLPDEKIRTLDESKTFLAGLSMVRQLEFALFDFRLHHEHRPGTRPRVLELAAEVRAEVAVVQPPEYNRFAHTFSHVFGGGYAAGYYSYKWAEVLAADAFAAFEEQDPFDPATAERFRRCILAAGGSRSAQDAFVCFRGRPPRLEALLRHSGILSSEADDGRSTASSASA